MSVHDLTFTTHLTDDTESPILVRATIRANAGEPGSLSITDTLYIDRLTVHAYDPRTRRISPEPIAHGQFTAVQIDALYTEAERLAGIRG